MEDKVIFLLGRSGSGKSTLADMLVARNKFTEIVSYTTRERRYKGEQGHIFVDTPTCLKPCEGGNDGPQLHDNVIAYTYFAGNHYWATREQIKGTTLYVIDQAGVDYFKKHFPEIPTISIYLDVPASQCFQRVLLRDGEKNAIDRFSHDNEAFRVIRADYTLSMYANNSKNCELIESILKDNGFL